MSIFKQLNNKKDSSYYRIKSRDASFGGRMTGLICQILWIFYTHVMDS